jgi:AcrR family transcriptional regulator
VEHILNTAGRVLDEVGLEGFNTNLLAERAKVRVRTIYRYFPDKYAVILALTRRMAEEWDERMDGHFRKLSDPTHDWEPEQRLIIPLLLKQIAERPGGRTIIKFIGVIPQLKELDQLLLERLSKKMSSALKQRGVKLPSARLDSICRVSLLSVTAGVDTYFRVENARRAQFLREWINMQIAYLRMYL